MISASKQCNKCGSFFLPSERYFSKDLLTNKFKPYCINCDRDKTKTKRIKAIPKYHKESENQTHQECNKCGNKYALTREFWGHNPNGSFRKTCRVCNRAQNRKWNYEHRKEQTERSTRYQARKKRWQPSTQLRLELFAKANGKCRYCFTGLGTDAQVDHAIPVSKGGTNEIENLDLICPRCNQEKGSKTPEEYIAWNKRSD